MADPRPLWEVMEESTGTVAEWGCVIRAVRDWLVPEERTLDPVWFGTVVEHESNFRRRLRALLTAEADRAQRQPVPPEPGEVQELVRVLHQAADNDEWDGASPEWCASLTRAAELLSQRHPQPVPVSERLPGPEDCDATGRCWLRRKYQPDGPTWRLTRPASIGTEALRLNYAEWLPAHALPLPGEVDHG